MQRCPTPIVLLSGSAEEAQRHSAEALSSGALAMVRAPDRRADHTQLLTTLCLMADVPVVTRHAARWAPAASQPCDAAPAPALAHAAARRTARRAARSIAGPQAAPPAPEVLALAASTGGPAALQSLLSGLAAALANSDGQAQPKQAPPILIAQHISRGFVQALADWLERTTSLPAHVVYDEQRLLPGHIYLACDGQHLLAGQAGAARLRPGAEHDRYCPSADALFESVAQVYGARSIGVVLTGMGDDGARGLWALRAAGGQTFAQDEASCVVYGMPGAAVAAGAVGQIAPLAGLAEIILRALG
jgi:two-component system chemotaxis response regulator CheB